MVTNIKQLVKTLPLFTTLEPDPDIIRLTHQLKHRYSKFLICGLGGSILTTQALLSIAPGHDIRCLDNIDPLTLSRLQQENLSDTGIIFISKSGTTAEILCQLSYLNPQHAVVITQDGDSPLRQIALEKNWDIINHPKDIGGRFAAFTPVGCLPCALMGLDPAEFIAGAQMALENVDKIIQEAHKLYTYYLQGFNIHVLWGYSDYLDGLLAWCCQLIAESLGKKDIHQKSFGFQPIANKGTIDQHSQLQLYLSGPHKYVFSLLLVNYDTISIPRVLNTSSAPNMELYQRHSANHFLNAYAKNTQYVLEKAGHHVRQIVLPDLSARSFGAMMMSFILETLAIADLAQINPFDQAAVEDSKKYVERFL